MKYPVSPRPSRHKLYCFCALSLTLLACASDPPARSDAGLDSAAISSDAPVADAPTADRGSPGNADVPPPLYACPATLTAADGGLLPARRTPGEVPVLAAPLDPATLPATDVVFSIDVSQGMWPISQDIYGMNSPGPKTPVDPSLRSTNERLGGNRLSAYNWENNASNAGNDYKFQNDGYLSASNAPGDAVRFVMDDAFAMGAGAVVTVPIGDYVSADKSPGGDVRSDGGTGYLSTRFRKNVASKNGPLSNPPDITDDSVYQDEFVSWAKGCAGDLPLTFSLDNEPDLWKGTHAEIHPEPVEYDELCERTIRFASAIKNVWPTAPILGFVSYGWNGYKTLQNAPDMGGKGEFVDYFLAQMKTAEAKAGRRLIDYLDLHWYPEAKGGGTRIVFDTAPTDATKLAAYQEARMQAPRSLWDTTYKETSWIADSLKGEAINLIPRMKQKIVANYPGTKLAFTEWNYGGGTDITGAIATADVLGIFGRERVDMAHIWPLSSKEPFVAAGMKVFRNYDGKSGQFGDIAIASTSSDSVTTSVYASLSSRRPSQVIVVAINKKSAPAIAGIRLAHPSTLANSKAFLLASSKSDLLPGTPAAAVGVNAFTYTMPERSVSVLVFDVPGASPTVDGGVEDAASTADTNPDQGGLETL